MSTQPSQFSQISQNITALAQDVDGISGKTPEEKAEAHEAFACLREGWHWLKGKRYGFLAGSLAAYCLLSVLQKLGVDTSQFSPYVYDFIHSLTGF
jgi:hypothetical protein